MTGWVNRTGENYWSPAQVRLFIDDVWIDDACAITYKVTDNKHPKFGYNDQFYRSISAGTTIVQGRLSINFRYNGYLRSVIMNHVRNRRDMDVLDRQDRAFKQKFSALNEEFLTYNETDILEWASAIAASNDEKMRESVFEYLKGIFWEPPPTSVPDRQDQAGGRPTQTKGQQEQRDLLQSLQRAGLITPGFNIIMVFGDDPANHIDPALVKVVQDVHIISEGVATNIEAPDGSRPVREVYDFFAKNVVPGKIAQNKELVG